MNTPTISQNLSVDELTLLVFTQIRIVAARLEAGVPIDPRTIADLVRLGSELCDLIVGER